MIARLQVETYPKNNIKDTILSWTQYKEDV